MKRYITLGILVFSTVGGWLGAELNHGNWFGLASTILSIVGALFGIWAGYMLGQWVDGG